MQVSPWRAGVSLRIRRKDPDDLIRLQAILGIGAVLEPSGSEERWTYRADNAEIQEIVSTVGHWLTPSRLTQLEQLGITTTT